jgi:hypothetical protein
MGPLDRKLTFFKEETDFLHQGGGRQDAKILTMAKSTYESSFSLVEQIVL